MASYEVPLSPAQSSLNEEDDEDSHKCRRCDLQILEGHAYELGGDRWHMYCFSCSKCSKLLGTSSNFLVLGTGDLICSDCSYACNACGKKIDDLAILTGDQAYCSTCFCCRNCKKRIEDLKYARTSKGLFCMSCHEKLLEKKRRHDNEKRLKARQSKLPNPDKSLPMVPPKDEPRTSQDYFRVMSPAETSSSDVSTPGVEVAAAATIDVSEIPPRSPERIHLQPQPQSAEKGRILEPPVAVSPMRFPSHLSPMLDNDEFEAKKENYFDGYDYCNQNNTEKLTEPSKSIHSSKSSHSTPKSQFLGIETPEKLQTRSPLRQNILTPNGKNRQAVVLGDLSSSSSNILSSYIKESPPPKVPPPKIPDEDFIDMDDSDDDTQRYVTKPPGFGEIRHSDSIPAGLNIQGLPSFDEHFEKDAEQQKQLEQPELKDEMQTHLSPQATHDSRHYRSHSASTQPRPSLDYEQEHEIEVPGSAKSWKNVLMSPTANSSTKKAQHSANGDGLTKSRSIRSPKNFLNFRKHKKSVSQTSVENYRISSPLMESRSGFEDNQISFHTPRIGQESPYSGAALFTTPPVPESEHLHAKSKHSMHGRSRSDANVDSGSDMGTHAELELRSLRIEIRDLKLTKVGVQREVNDLSAQRDEMNLEIAQLQSKLDQLKLQLQGQSSKSSLEDISESKPYSSNTQQHSSNTQTLHSTTPNSAQQPHSAQSSNTSSSTPTVAMAEQVNVDSKQKSTKARFWKRFGAKGDGMANSQSAYSLSHLINDNTKSGNPQISAPIMRSDETDELGGNDNKKLMNTKGYSLENGNSSGQSVATNGSANALIMSDLFSSSLEMRAMYEKRPVPLIISRLVSEVEKKGLDSEGVYRKNGATSQMNAILKAFNNLYQAETSQELETSLSGCDVNAVTSSLKRYLYFHLPEPVITMQVYEQYIAVSKLTDDQAKVEALGKVVMQLPKTNSRTLIILLTHLKKIESYAHLNKMNFHNLSVVFAPTLARVSDGERELMDMGPRNNVTEFLLIRQDDILARIDTP